MLNPARRSKSFQGEKRNEKFFDTLKAGDYLFIQFGHNDQKPAAVHTRDAFTTLRGPAEAGNRRHPRAAGVSGARELP